MAPTLRILTQRSALFRGYFRKTAFPTPIARRSRFYSNEAGYGDSASPVADHPKQQGPRQRGDLEHPGPQPVAEGRPNSPRDSPSYSSSFAGGGSNNHSHGQGNKQAGDSTSGAKPKILDPNDTGKNSGRGDPEVEKHNREMNKGSEVEATEDKVEKNYWTGIGGKHGH